MVSIPKRMKYVSENELTSSEEEESYDDTDYHQNKQKMHKNARATRTPKCFSRNALMARENRMKKKLYLDKLEHQVSSLKTDNKKLVTVVDNQSFLIAELKKEVKYLKSVITNSPDISKLIRNIHQSTARKTAHPWDNNDKQYPSYPTPDSMTFSSSPTSEHGLLDFDPMEIPALDFPLSVSDEQLFDVLQDQVDAKVEIPKIELNEHNYTVKSEDSHSSALLEDAEDVGVCLHVSRSRVSLEFCSSCSENAGHAWKD